MKETVSGRIIYPVRVAIRDERIVYLKVCAKCHQEKVCVDAPDSEFWGRIRRGDKVILWHSYCKDCDKQYVRDRREQINARRRARHAERMATDFEYRRRHNERSRRSNEKWLQKPEAKEKALSLSREYHRRTRLEDAETVRESQRMQYAMRQERKGKTIRRTSTVLDGTAPRVLIAPFQRWLTAYLEVDGRPWETVAHDLGMSPRRVRSVMSGEYAKVGVDVVDRALLNAGRVIEIDGKPILRFDDLYSVEIRG